MEDVCRLGSLSGRFFTQLSLDKPLYQPGETIFYRSLTLSCFSLAAERETAVHYEILDPSDVALPEFRALTRRPTMAWATAHSIFPTICPAANTRWWFAARTNRFPNRAKIPYSPLPQPASERNCSSQGGRYSAGDTVSADFSVKRQENEPAAERALHVLGTVDGQTLLDRNAQADQDGKFHIELKLPDKIAAGNAQLAVTVSDGGARETISKTIPISLGKVEVHFYPEGGDLAAGLENRVYFVCRDTLGRPLHMSGVIENERGRTMAAVETTATAWANSLSRPRRVKHIGSRCLIRQGCKTSISCPPRPPIARSRLPPAPAFLAHKSRSSSTSARRKPGCRWWWRPGREGSWWARAAGYKKSENGMNSVELPLGEEVAGIIRLTVFDYSGRARSIYRGVSQSHWPNGSCIAARTAD